MVRPRVNGTRIYVLVDDPRQGRSIMEVLGTVTTTTEYPMFEESPVERTIRLEGHIVRQVVWDGRSPMTDQPELEAPQRELTISEETDHG